MKTIIFRALLYSFFLILSIQPQNKKIFLSKGRSLTVQQVAAIIGFIKTFTPSRRTLGYFKDGKFIAPKIR